MADAAPQPPHNNRPSAELPLMDDMRLHMLIALDCNSSLFGAVWLLPGWIKDLERIIISRDTGDITLYSTLSDFVVDDCIKTAKLTQFVHPKMLRSIVQGTVAYDCENGTITDSDYYGDHFSGTYMVSVAIEGRKGSFLNASELTSLAAQIREYFDAAKAWDQDKSWDFVNDAQHAHFHSFVRSVGAPYFVPTDPLAGPKYAKNAQPSSVHDEVTEDQIFRAKVHVFADCSWAKENFDRHKERCLCTSNKLDILEHQKEYGKLNLPARMEPLKLSRLERQANDQEYLRARKRCEDRNAQQGANAKEMMEITDGMKAMEILMPKIKE